MCSSELADVLDAQVGEEMQGKVTLFFSYPVKEFSKRISNLEMVDDFTIPEPSLEEYFLPLYKK